MTYLGAGGPCRECGPTTQASWPTIDDEGELGAIVGAVVSIASVVSGFFSFGGKPLTEVGKRLSRFARGRGIELKAADQWAREWEKQRDKLCPDSKPPVELAKCRAEAVIRMVDQYNPPITADEWQQLIALKAWTYPGMLPAALSMVPPGFVLPASPSVPVQPIKPQPAFAVPKPVLPPPAPGVPAVKGIAAGVGFAGGGVLLGIAAVAGFLLLGRRKRGGRRR